MANWPDPRSTSAGFGGVNAGAVRADHDAGLRSYMLSIYNYMASGVLVTGLVAMLFAPYAMQVLISPNGHGLSLLGWVIFLAPLGFVMTLNFGINRLQTSTAQLLFWGYSLVNGLSLSVIFLAYTNTSIAQAFFATAAGFAGLSLFGYTTKRDLSPFGTFLIMGVFGILIAMLLNIWLQSTALALAISILGVLVFAGLTAYDTQKLKSMYSYVAGTDQMGKVVIMGALNLYLDFINMFLFLLRLFGSRR